MAIGNGVTTTAAAEGNDCRALARPLVRRYRQLLGLHQAAVMVT
jgi:hypothetical protein